MNLIEYLSPARTLLGGHASSKKKALELIGEIIAGDNPELSSQNILECLFQRERFGTTAIGNGVALPHGRLSGCESPTAALLMLSEGVTFDAPDAEPVDILFGLLLPEDDTSIDSAQLQKIATLLSQPVTQAQLRHAHCSEALLEILACAAAQDKKSERPPAH